MTDTESVIDEIRESRKRMSEQCDHDPQKVVEYLKAFTDKYSSQVKAYREKHLPVRTEAETHQ